MAELLDQLLSHLRAIWLRRFWGLAGAWLVAIVGLSYALLTPSQHEATARVFVDTESLLKPLMVGLAVQPNTNQQVRMLADTLLSRPNVEKLILLADLDHAAKTAEDREALIDRVTRRVELKGSPKDNMFLLSYRDTDPSRAKRVIDSLLSMFVESGLSNKRIDTEKAMSFLDEQITQYEQVLREAEERLKNFKLANLDRLGSSQDSVGSMLALDADIEKVRTELRAAEQRRDALRKQLASEDPVFLSDSTGGPAASAPGMDPLAEIDSRADALRRNLDELLRRYTEEHPDVVGTRRILAELERQRESVLEDQRRAGPASRSKGTTRREPNLVYQQLKVALADAEANVAALGGRLSELEARYSRIRAAARLRPEFEAELAQLNRDYQIQKTNFEQLVQRREQAKMTGNLDQSGSVAFRVIDPPRVSSQPVAPNRPRLLLAVMFLSVAAGVGASLAVSQLFPVVSTTKDLRLVSQMSVLGSVSLRPSPAQILHRKRKNYAFGGGVAGLVAVFGFAVTAIVAAVVR